MKRFFFAFLLCGALCGAGAAHVYAAEVINIPGADVVVNEDGSVDVYEYDGVESSDSLEDFFNGDLDESESESEPDESNGDVITSDKLLDILEGFAHPEPSAPEGEDLDPGVDEEPLVPDEEPVGTVSGNFVDWDVMYYDHVNEQGNDVTTKYTKYMDGSTLYMSQEDYEGGLELLSAYGTYYGLISSQYLDLFRGLAVKLGINEHYVCARVGQYDYIFAHSPNLSLSGSTFTGSGVTVVTYHTNNNGYFTSEVQSSFTLSGASYIVYSDLGKDYPSLLENRDVYARATFFLLGVVVIGYFINSFFGKGVVTNAIRKSKKKEVY